ncbi:MAG: O-antigen ligase family protein [Chitinispirillaceae bacterium]|nr:O-antigen ligase family protein [Chitinispirillaceae bacterium]
MKRWWVLDLSFFKKNVDAIFAVGIIFAAMLDLRALNIGLNLRLSTVLILSYLLITIKRFPKVLQFILKHYWVILIVGCYYLSLFMSISGADILLLAIKQFILYIFLFLTVMFFLSLKQEKEMFSKTVMGSLFVVFLVVNIYALLQPIIAFKSGIIGFLVRPTGFFPEANMLGLSQTMMMGYILAFYLAQIQVRSLKLKALFIVLTIIPLLFLTNNRATIIAMLMQIVLAFVLFFKKIWKMRTKVTIMAFTSIIIVTSMFYCTRFIPALHGNGNLYEFSMDRFRDILKKDKSKRESITVRMSSIRIAISKFYEYPVFGGGLANASTELTSDVKGYLKQRNYTQIRQSTEVVPFDVVGETGVFGIITTAVFYLMVLFIAFNNSIYFFRERYVFVLTAGSLFAIWGMLFNGIGSSPLTAHFFWWNIGVVFYIWKMRLSESRFTREQSYQVV